MTTLEKQIVFIVLAFTGLGIATFLYDQRPREKAEVEPTVPEEFEPEPDPSLLFVPPLFEPGLLPIPDVLEPNLTWDDVDERLSYLVLTDKLGRGKKETGYVGNTAFLIVSNTRLSASTFYRRWIQSIKREGLNLKGKEFSVTVVGNNSYVERTHHCTASGAH
jgi:hypothetical protein